jgi:anti-sigma factor RsiW
MEDQHPSRYTLTRYHAGELPGADRERVGTHLRDCQECAAFLEELTEAKKNFHAGRDRLTFLDQVQAAPVPEDESPRTGHRWWHPVMQPAALLAAAAVLALIVLVIPWRTSDEPTGERMKGDELALGFYVMEDSGPVVASSDRILHPGDRIQFRLTAPAGGFVHIVGIDESKAVNVYFPLPQETPEAFPGGAGRPVPGSVILDATLGKERVFVLICKQPVARDTLVEKVMNVPGGPRAALDQKRLPLDCRQTSLLLRKE